MVPMNVDWIIEGLRHAGKTRAGLARAMGVDRAAVTRLLKGERKLLASEVPIVEAYLQSSGEAPAAGGMRRAIINEIDVRAGAGGGAMDHTEKVRHVGRGMTIRVDDLRGQWELPDQYVRQELRVVPERVQIIEILGDSMSPTLESGDRVMVDTSHTAPSPPGIYALFDGLGVVVKRLEVIHGTDPVMIRVVSDNSHHSPHEVTLEEARIIGRIVWRATQL